jgi:hypothetical protein
LTENLLVSAVIAFAGLCGLYPKRAAHLLAAIAGAALLLVALMLLISGLSAIPAAIGLVPFLLLLLMFQRA